MKTEARELLVSEGTFAPVEPERLPEAPLAISVVIPVHNGAEQLRQCLGAIAASTVRPFEVIVVDDCSTDASPQVAGHFGAKVLSTAKQSGPARARNLGATEARGSILLFLDADVCVHADTIAKVLEDFKANPNLDALIGSYDNSPDAENFISQYRNLMHAFVHQNASRVASTFWSGCGAIRRERFLAHGGFDETFGRPAIEDIELGARLARSGGRIMLDSQVQVKHLKRWTFGNLLKTDVLDRGIPWTELILREHHMPNDLNLKVLQRVSVALVFLAIVLGAAALVVHQGKFLTPMLALLFLMLSRYWVDEAGPRSPGTFIASAGLFATTLIWASFYDQLSLIIALAAGWCFLYLRRRYTSEKEQHRKYTGVLYSIYSLGVVIYSVALLPSGKLAPAFLVISFCVVAINYPFYWFMARKLGRLYAIAAIPLHLLYYFYSGLSFLIGFVRYACRNLRARRQVAPRTPSL